MTERREDLDRHAQQLTGDPDDRRDGAGQIACTKQDDSWALAGHRVDEDIARGGAAVGETSPARRVVSRSAALCASGE
jgi:hypothetical protein